MTGSQAEPSAQALGESLAALAAQVATLRDQVTQVNDRLNRAGLRGELDLAARFEELARTVASALDAAAPRGPAAPCWIGLDRQSFDAQLARLRRWADTVLRQHYPGYELRVCWPGHIHAIWELSTLAAEWHHIYGGERPDLARALEFYDRWLPGTMRRIAAITQSCVRNAPCAAASSDRRKELSSRREVTGISGMRGHVLDYGVGIPCFRVQIGVRVVFGRAPEPVALVPEDGPAGVIAEEAGDTGGLCGRGDLGHDVLPGIREWAHLQCRWSRRYKLVQSV